MRSVKKKKKGKTNQTHNQSCWHFCLGINPFGRWLSSTLCRTVEKESKQRIHTEAEKDTHFHEHGSLYSYKATKCQNFSTAKTKIEVLKLNPKDVQNSLQKNTVMRLQIADIL